MLEGIRALILDVDGVFTDGRLWYGAEGEAIKPFHARDGQGVKLVMAAGVEVAIVSAKDSAPLRRRLDDLGVEHRVLACQDKGAAIRGLAVALGVRLAEMAYVGDDVIDLPAMEQVGLPIAVADAHARVRAFARWVTKRPGGDGAVREVCDHILEALGGTTRYRIVIPARYASSRLPAKPLADLGGKPMVVRVAERAKRCGADSIVVAIDDRRVGDALAEARLEGVKSVRTRKDHVSGTDRIAEVAETLEWEDDDIVVNLQGDEPLVPVSLPGRLARALTTHPSASIATAAAPIRGCEAYLNENVVKVVCDDEGLALLFTRAPVPWIRGRMNDLTDEDVQGIGALHHIGLYAYTVRTLRELSGASPVGIETTESLEQLRAMHLGRRIHVTVLNEAPPPGIDTPEDLERAQASFATD